MIVEQIKRFRSLIYLLFLIALVGYIVSSVLLTISIRSEDRSMSYKLADAMNGFLISAFVLGFFVGVARSKYF
jgi:hypothetical protein